MQSVTRRHFFYSAGMALTAAQATRVMGANDRVHVAIIGLGGRGRNHMSTYAKLADAEIVALCDVNQEALERGQAQVLRDTQQKPKGVVDMLDVFNDPNVQAVSMPLPNHWHALATIRACQHGKDVYVEKPACHNVFEGQRMIDAARKYNRMVQVGSQGRSQAHKIKAIGLLNEGIIGKVYLSKGLCFKRRKSIGHKADSPTPPGLDWDKFLGPAPMRPFNELRFRYNWHWFWDTGNGDIGNQGIHQMDIARWGFGRPGLPMSVVSTGGKYVYNDDQETPNTQIATFNYGDAEIMFEVRGLQTGNEGGIAADRGGGNVIGNLFYGGEGWMMLDGGGFQVYKGDPAKKIMDEKAARDENAHFQNFIDCVKSRDKSKLNAEVAIGVQSANLVHLANASYRVGKELKFDEKTLTFPGEKEATALLTRKYRAPYIVPEKV